MPTYHIIYHKFFHIYHSPNFFIMLHHYLKIFYILSYTFLSTADVSDLFPVAKVFSSSKLQERELVEQHWYPIKYFEYDYTMESKKPTSYKSYVSSIPSESFVTENRAATELFYKSLDLQRPWSEPDYKQFTLPTSGVYKTLYAADTDCSQCSLKSKYPNVVDSSQVTPVPSADQYKYFYAKEIEYWRPSCLMINYAASTDLHSICAASKDPSTAAYKACSGACDTLKRCSDPRILQTQLSEVLHPIALSLSLDDGCWQIIHSTPYFRPMCHIPKRCGKVIYHNVPPSSIWSKLTNWLGYETKICYGENFYNITIVETRMYNVRMRDFNCDPSRVIERQDFVLIETPTGYSFYPNSSYLLHSINQSPSFLPKVTSIEPINETHFSVSADYQSLSKHVAPPIFSQPTIMEAFSKSHIMLRLLPCPFLRTVDFTCYTRCFPSKGEWYYLGEDLIVTHTNNNDINYWSCSEFNTQDLDTTTISRETLFINVDDHGVGFFEVLDIFFEELFLKFLFSVLKPLGEYLLSLLTKNIELVYSSIQIHFPFLLQFSIYFLDTLLVFLPIQIIRKEWISSLIVSVLLVLLKFFINKLIKFYLA